MDFKDKINNVIQLFNDEILDAKSLAQSIQNIISRYHFFEIEIEYRIGKFQFSVEEIANGIVVTAYHNGKKHFTRVFDEETHENHIYNYCNKFATCRTYRSQRITGKLV